MRFLLTTVLGMGLLLGNIQAHAIPISNGSLSSNDDGSTQIITDTLNNLEWLRWDVLADLTHAETVAAIGAGGAYEGWAIADNAAAQLFVDAMFSDSGGANCNTSNGVSFEVCGNPIINSNLLTGDDYISDGDSAVWFLNTVGTADVGILYSFVEAGYVLEDANNTTFSGSDRYSSSGPDASTPISWLLYREAPVPEPATLTLMVLGLAGIGFARRKKA